MNKIVFKQDLAPDIKKIVLEAPLVAKKVLPGEFVVLIVDEKGERVPLTVVDSDKEKGTIALIFQEVGKTTYKLGELKVGEVILNLLGPLGRATEIKKLGTVVTVGGGVGIAEVYPVTRAFKEAGNSIISIIGARTKGLLILEKELRRMCDELFVTTDDGTYGRRGFVSDVLKETIGSTKADLVYAVGPVPMMRVVSELTRPYGIKTLVSLNPVMVDATGMCGSCRVSVGGETKFGCVDGPEFDGHLVDFAQLEKRLNLFSEQEKRAMECFKSKGTEG
ncbi:MAG: sulfide/dihydroorotate dehydrogenase-like FAD/NAD-binding protein [Candidatus Omnitrophica bacterium]|nr:sulfide/dihydroorotate dehydrogenase-like FAD/NAD-binding protein [Candidatus Omnitrophota bacterium]MBU4140700.1 sulfide/dihydroorotate dehydrogenase-like FAD/NAD-binding protein [Candidatus Omnitrophota bacterium]